ncbi:hypothetical protein K1T71_004766 [Dendrolimus kikuchii]|uniref:Uncharacterized protein n=1 Tax=Dendrolimus kikuchii TaxID=765133 RepID=A0ACC1D8J7_9NEOP|nr:hypothetical protein K1T71_004766 [Dendrolimus kikuchii]
MLSPKSCIARILCSLCAFVLYAFALPDSGGHVPLPGPGLSYGGLPYGSMSGNVAEYFKQRESSSGRTSNLASFAPIVYRPNY